MVGVVVFAYVLNGLRTSFVRLWSGLFAFPLLNPFLRFGEHLERGRYLKMKEIADRPSKKWDELFQWFRNEVSPHWNRDKPHIDEHNHQKLKTKVVSLRQEMSREEIKSILTAVIDAHKHYHGDSLGEIYKKVKDKLDYWYEQERGEIAGALSTLGQQFGTISSIRATALGNVVESYSVYPYRCYGMEHAEVLWPRLQYVIKPAFLTTIQEPRILLDFCLASATLSSFFGLLALIGGPWLWLNGWFWGILTLMAFFISYFFYRVGVFVATQYGEIVSASFDLFRLDLLSILHRGHPTTLSEEKQKWKELSQLFAFGHVNNSDTFDIRPRASHDV